MKTEHMTGLIVFIILLVHGIGHLQGVFISLGIKDFGSWNTNSWMLSSWLSNNAQRIICLLLFLVTALLILAGAFSFRGLLLPQSWWQQLTLIAAVLSSLAFLIFPNPFAMFLNKIGTVAVNLLTFYTLLTSSAWIENFSR